MYKIKLRLKSKSFDRCRMFVIYVLFNSFRVWFMYYRSVDRSLLSTSGDRDFSYRWRRDKDDVSETYDLGLLEGVVGVTLREFVVFDIEDSGVEGILGADGDISGKKPGFLEWVFNRLSLR